MIKYQTIEEYVAAYKQELELLVRRQDRRVVIEVLGGVAECTLAPDDVDVEIIDHDNETDE